MAGLIIYEINIYYIALIDCRQFMNSSLLHFHAY